MPTKIYRITMNDFWIFALKQTYSALIWQKEASDKSDISRKRAKCVCHLH